MNTFRETALPEIIATPRLRLRPWRLGDVDDVYSYARDEEWSKYLRLLPRPYSPGDAEQFIARQLLLDRAEHPSWAITLEGPGEGTGEETGKGPGKGTGKVIGGINLRVSAEHRLGEVGYSIARDHWNRGFCTEAAQAVVDSAFETLPGLSRIRAMADVDNTASQRVLEKLGMTKEGVLRQNRIERGEAVDEAWFGILRSEWTGAAT